MFQRFVVQMPSTIADTGLSDDDATGKGSFVTEQTLASFVGASAITLILWKFGARLLPEQLGDPLNTVWIALIVGAAVLFLSWPVDRTGKLVPFGSRAGISAVIVGFFNSLILAAAAIGIDVSGISGE